jgi:hypothetical protein
MALFTTTSGLYGGVLWGGELQGFVIHEVVPSQMRSCYEVRAVQSSPFPPCAARRLISAAVGQGMVGGAQGPLPDPAPLVSICVRACVRACVLEI